MQSHPEKPSAGLIRALGPLTALAVVVGTVIGSGIFKKPSQVAENVPYFGLAISVWVLGGLLAVLGALTVAEVAVLFPRSGGNYVFLREGYGRLAGFLWGWVDFWIIRGASIAALATIFTESLHDILKTPAVREALRFHGEGDPLSFWQQRGLTVAVILGLAIVNVRGVRWGGLLQLLITLVKIASLLAIMALPFLAGAGALDTAVRPDWSHLSPSVPPDLGTLDGRFWAGYGSALVGVLFAYHGWMNIVPIAEEIRNPQRNLPLALLGGTALVILLYLGANLAYYLIFPGEEIAGMKETTVATQLCLRLFRNTGAAVASAAVMCSVFGALNGNLLVGPRVLYAMGEDGLAPRILGEVHAHYRTPAVAILITGVWSAALVLLGAALTHNRLPILSLGSLGELDLNVPEKKSVFDLLTDFAMFGAIIFETLAVATIFVFRFRYPDAGRSYRCWGYPVVPIVYIGIMALVLVNMFREQRTESLIGVGFIAVGAAVYWLAVPRQAKSGIALPPNSV